jgi:putative transposase
MASFEVSQRRACAVVGQPRSTQRLAPAPVPDAEQHLRARLRDLAAAHPRYGYRRLGVLLARAGYRFHHKRVQRLCRQEGLRVRVKKRKRSRVGASTIPNDRLVAEGPNHVWALDFAYDQTADCRTLKDLTITDEFTKHALAIEVERSMTGDDIITVLERRIMVHGAPGFVRMDNGTEMTSNAVADWCRFSPAWIAFIDPGSPWQNAYVESFTGRLRDELLAVEVFHTLLEAKIMAEDLRQHYNAHRPHSSLGYLTPDEFVLQWTNTNPGLTKSLAH